MKSQKFSFFGAAYLAPDVMDLVARNKDWLDAVRPGVSEGYKDRDTAIGRIKRIARNKNLDAVLFKKDNVAVALGTIIANQVITIADGYELHGTDLDCWTDGETVFDYQDENNLLYDMLQAAHIKPNDTAFAALKPQEIGRAVGITKLHRLSNPQIISVKGDDPYDIAKGGVPLQLYTN